ncbi:hypothetical protein L9G74_19305 [Shewanella sp. C32]|uniref:Uncharacterized protein n=1 Tax=Shewanella electrica TaxID=515560 RepID=A0ABT2FTM3_9GAMM|nr:hypothetical protein [Shewanella electrica]MCH1926968.1 hypothetical protein [Shewanella electrica]MCS4558589.1 hypothetical protein [Shewanella electrica]
MSKQFSDDLEQLATYGLAAIDANEQVTVNLKDLLYVFATLQEFQRFFHQPQHYQTLADIERFLGSVNDPRAYKLLHTAIHAKMRPMLPAHISDKYDDGDFDAPQLPFYYDADR